MRAGSNQTSREQFLPAEVGGGQGSILLLSRLLTGVFLSFFKKNVDLCADRSSRGAAVKASEAMTEACT